MLETIPNLWAGELKSTIVTPVAILRAQASQLRRLTQGVLDAEVTVRYDSDGQVVLGLEIIARGLHDYRHRLLSVRHQPDEVYPATVFSGILKETKTVAEPNIWGMERPSNLSNQRKVTEEAEQKVAYTEEKFLAILKEVLQAPETIAALQSLIVRSNEATNLGDPIEVSDAIETQVDEQNVEDEE